MPSDTGLSVAAGSGARGRTRSSPSTPSRGRYAGRVYVSYTQTDFQGDKGVAVTVFDARLRPLAGYPVANKPLLASPPSQAKPADRFWPASALDSANGMLWVCFYDTNGDPDCKKAWFSCTTSTNGGRRWSPVVRAATAPTDETQPDADSHEYGDYEGLAVANGAAHRTDGRPRPQPERRELHDRPHGRQHTAGPGQLTGGAGVGYGRRPLSSTYFHSAEGSANGGPVSFLRRRVDLAAFDAS